MFIGLIMGLVFGLSSMGGGSEGDVFFQNLNQWQKAVEKEVDDKDRKKELLIFIGNLREELSPLVDRLTVSMKKYLEVDARYDATWEEYQAAIKENQDAWLTMSQWMLDARLKASTLLTEKESARVQRRVNRSTAAMRQNLLKNARSARHKHKTRVKKYEAKHNVHYVRPKHVPPKQESSAPAP